MTEAMSAKLTVIEVISSGGGVLKVVRMAVIGGSDDDE